MASQATTGGLRLWLVTAEPKRQPVSQNSVRGDNDKGDIEGFNEAEAGVGADLELARKKGEDDGWVAEEENRRLALWEAARVCGVDVIGCFDWRRRLRLKLTHNHYRLK